MFVSIKDLEAALNSKSYFDLVINGILIRRRFWINPILFLMLNAFFIYLNISGNRYLPDNITLYIVYPFLIYLVSLFILAFAERWILKGFDNKNRDLKISSLKTYFIVSVFIRLFALTLVIEYESLINTAFFTVGNIYTILIKLFFSIIFAMFLNPFNKELSKIENQGILSKTDNQ